MSVTAPRKAKVRPPAKTEDLDRTLGRVLNHIGSWKEHRLRQLAATVPELERIAGGQTTRDELQAALRTKARTFHQSDPARLSELGEAITRINQTILKQA